MSENKTDTLKGGVQGLLNIGKTLHNIDNVSDAVHAAKNLQKDAQNVQKAGNLVKDIYNNISNAQLEQRHKKGVQQACQISKTQFGILSREHKCKRCWRSIVAQHTKESIPIPSYKFDSIKPHKICTICSQEVNSVKTIINPPSVSGQPTNANSKVSFGKTSSYGYTLLDGLLKNRDEVKAKADFEALVADLNTPNAHAKAEFSSFEKLLNDSNSLSELYPNNYSFYDTYHHIQNESKLAFGEIKKYITSVCYAFIKSHHEEVGFSREIFDVAIFLLCFQEPHRAWFTLTLLYKQAVPKRFWPSQANTPESNDQSHIPWIRKILKDYFQISEQNKLQKAQDFLKVFLNSLMSSLCIARTNFMVSITILANITQSKQKEDFDHDLALYRAIFTIVHYSQDLIYGKKMNDPELPFEILRNLTIENVRAKLSPKEPTKRIKFARDEPPQPQIIQQQPHHHHVEPVRQVVQEVIKTVEPVRIVEAVRQVEPVFVQAVSKLIEPVVEHVETVQHHHYEEPVVHVDRTQPFEFVGEQVLFDLQRHNLYQREMIVQMERSNNILEAENRSLRSENAILQSRFGGVPLQSTSHTIQEFDSLQREREDLNLIAHRLSNEKEEINKQLYQLRDKYEDLLVKYAIIEQGYAGNTIEKTAELEERLRISEYNLVELEEKYVKSCLKLIIVGAENMRLQNQGSEFDTYRRYTKDARKNTIQWQSEIGVVMVKLKNKEDELNRAKKALHNLQEEFQSKFNQLKHDYDTVATQELRKFQQQFEIEKQFFQKALLEKDQQIQQNTLLAFSQIQAGTQSTIVNPEHQGLHGRLNQLEDEKAILNRDLQAYIYKFQTLERDFNRQLELRLKEAQFNSVSQIEYDQLRERLTTQVNIANEKLNQMESRLAILQQENFKQNSINSEIAKDIEFYRQQNLQLSEQVGISQSELQKREAIVRNLEGELNHVRQTSLSHSQQLTQSLTIQQGVNPHMVTDIQQDRKNLIDEIQALRTEIEGLRISYSAQLSEVARLQQKLERAEKEHIEEIGRLKTDYELVCQSTVNNSMIKIQQTEERYKEKLLRADERINQLTLEIRSRLSFTEGFENEKQLFIQQIRSKDMENEDLRKQLALYVQELEQLRFRLNDSSQYTARISQLEVHNAELRRDLDIYSHTNREKDEVINRLNIQFSEKARGYEEYDRLQATWRFERDELLRKIAGLEELNVYGGQAQERFRQALVRIFLLTAENERLRSQTGSAHEITLVRNELNVHLSRFQDLEREYTHVRQDKDRLEQRLHQMTQELQSRSTQGDHHQQLSAQIEILRTQNFELDTRNRQQQENIHALEKMLIEVEQQLSITPDFQQEKQFYISKISQLESQLNQLAIGSADKKQALMRVILLSAENERLSRLAGK